MQSSRHLVLSCFGLFWVVLICFGLFGLFGVVWVRIIRRLIKVVLRDVVVKYWLRLDIPHNINVMRIFEWYKCYELR